jgi:hypothetical protein
MATEHLVGQYHFVLVQARVELFWRGKEMKRVWRIVAVTLLLVASSVRCSRMDGPEAATNRNFSEWAVNIRVPYKHENFRTINSDGRSATVHITVELKIREEWIEKETEVHCEKVDDIWQCDRAMLFK